MLLATWNIHYGVGDDGLYDLDRIAGILATADIVCLQEVVQGWRQNGYADQATELAARLDRHVWFHGAFDSDASGRDSSGRVANRRRTFGNAILSRWPIVTATGHVLPKQALREGFDLQRSVIEATIAAPAGALRIYNTHLSHVGPALRKPQLEAVLALMSGAAARGPMWDNAAFEGFLFSDTAPVVPAAAVLMGDLNFTAADAEYAHVSSALADAWRAGGNAETVESFRGWGRIDHCFVTADLAGQVTRAWIDTTTRASDHWPLFVELAWG
jgi:endonuclease/exonuclease/phosphatase family metal-dependent hydrolase